VRSRVEEISGQRFYQGHEVEERKVVTLESFNGMVRIQFGMVDLVLQGAFPQVRVVSESCDSVGTIKVTVVTSARDRAGAAYVACISVNLSSITMSWMIHQHFLFPKITLY